MHLGRRLRDALRHPARTAAMVRRAWWLWRRGALGDTLRRARAQGFSTAEYRRWFVAQRAGAVSEASGPPVAMLVLIDAEMDPGPLIEQGRSPSLRGALVRAAPGYWRTAGSRSDGSVRSLPEWLEVTAAEWVLWIAASVTLEPNTFDAFVSTIRSVPEARIVYCDEDALGPESGLSSPRFKSAWDRERILETNYVGDVVALRASLARAAAEPGRTGTEVIWRALLHARTRIAPAAIVHLPRVLVHRLRTGQAPVAPPCDAVLASIEREGDAATVQAAGERVEITFALPNPQPLISIIVPTRDRAPLLRRCVDSIVARRGARPVEIIAVDNGSRERDALDYLATLETVIRAPGPFNFPALCNAGARAARGEVLVFLNNDTFAQDPGWIDELVSLALRRRVGAVGPLLVHEDERIQSAGVFLGVNRTASNVLAGYRRDSPFARHWCATRRRVSAVSGACLAVEATKLASVGGWDEAFAVSHNEIDLCLRLERTGFATLFTPHACIVHAEGGTRGYELTRDERERLDREEALFRARWGEVLAHPDPAHNPNLAQAGDPFGLGPPLAPRLGRAGWRGDESRELIVPHHG